MISSGSGSSKSDYATLEDEGRTTKIEKTSTAITVAFEAMYVEAPVQKRSIDDTASQRSELERACGRAHEKVA